jgi:hypothetical protein
MNLVCSLNQVHEFPHSGARQFEFSILVPELWPLWERAIASTLEFSGIRLRNLTHHS